MCIFKYILLIYFIYIVIYFIVHYLNFSYGHVFEHRNLENYIIHKCYVLYFWVFSTWDIKYVLYIATYKYVVGSLMSYLSVLKGAITYRFYSWARKILKELYLYRTPHYTCMYLLYVSWISNDILQAFCLNVFWMLLYIHMT